MFLADPAELAEHLDSVDEDTTSNADEDMYGSCEIV